MNLITFKSKEDLPITLYFDFEATALTDSCFDPDQNKMFVMSYVLIVAFHPHLNLKKKLLHKEVTGTHYNK